MDQSVEFMSVVGVMMRRAQFAKRDSPTGGTERL